MFIQTRWLLELGTAQVYFHDYYATQLSDKYNQTGGNRVSLCECWSSLYFANCLTNYLNCYASAIQFHTGTAGVTFFIYDDCCVTTKV